jgi:hypothetical protein
MLTAPITHRLPRSSRTPRLKLPPLKREAAPITSVTAGPETAASCEMLERAALAE